MFSGVLIFIEFPIWRPHFEIASIIAAAGAAAENS